MKQVSNNYKNRVKEFGRQFDIKITYKQNGINTELGNAELNSVSPNFKGSLLKSTMKELVIDSTIDIPLKTILKCELGIFINYSYEYINFGNYRVVSSEYKADTKSYEIKCYDFMINAMTEYNGLHNFTFPATVKEYLTALCHEISLEFANEYGVFVNSERVINSDLYVGLGYTFRDIFDELSQVTASSICINNDNEVEVRYINNTNETIDGSYLKSVNVNFGKKYGPINSIVLSRSAGADNVYLQDEASVAQNGLHELKISDNQIMNFNDRSDYLPEILAKLGGLEYYINDFSSTGITFFELCDMYTINHENKNYKCIMFNDEINITQGIEENIYTEMPEDAETDYTKADKTDRKINQTYLIIDKQNQQIQAVISQTDSQNQKIAQITATVDELNSKISDIADITVSGESSYGVVNLTNVNESEPVYLKIRPIVDSITALYPANYLYPRNDLYMTNRKIQFKNTKTNEVFYYELPFDLLYMDEDNYDEFTLGYENNTCQLFKKCKYDTNGDIVKMITPSRIDYPYPTINLTEGDYEVSIVGHNRGYIYVTLMAKNIYTSQFYTKAETNSIIDQTSHSIDLSVNQKLSNYSTTLQMNSAITLKSNEITSSVNETFKNYSTTSQMNSSINQKANEITSSVSQTYATKTTTNALSSRIKQTATTIELATKDNNTSAGLTIRLKNEDGTQLDSKTANITMSGLVKFTDLSGKDATTIDGSNIKTGTISADRIGASSITASKLASSAVTADKISSSAITSSKISSNAITASKIASGAITADKISAGAITADKIATNAINADMISGGTINGNKITVTNLDAGNLKSGTLSSANIGIDNGTGFLKMLSGTAYNPYVSALNVSNKSNGISFRNSSTSGNAGSQIGTVHTENQNLVIDATGNILIGGSSMSEGAVGVWSGYIHAGNMSIGGNYINNDLGGQIAINQSIVLYPFRDGAAFVGGMNDSNKILTVGGSPSSLSVKESVEKKDTSDIPEILRNIDLYDYKYINEIENGKKDYGYIIDYLERIPNIDKYFDFMDASYKDINYKQISHERIEKFLLGAVIELQRQLDKFQEKNYNLSEEDK